MPLPRRLDSDFPPDSGVDLYPRGRDLTPRACLLGLVLVVVVNIGAPYAKYILHASLLACDYLPMGVLLPFILSVAVLNPAIKLLRSRGGLTPGELAVAFIMALVGSTVPTFGLTGYLVSTIAAPYYYATTQNGWTEYLQPHLPRWLIPSNEGSAMTWFFEGLPAGGQIPWSAWALPLAWWMSFAGAVLVVCFCLVSILRRQWIDRERIVFPLAKVPLEMVAESGSPRLLPAFMRSRVFWLGFGIPLAIVLWNVAGYFLQGFPSIPLRNRLTMFRGAHPLRLDFHFPLMGFAYLINLDVAFSIWFFHLLGALQVGLYNRFGYTIGGSETYCSASPPMGWQGFGGFIVLVGWGLWMARDHLGDVFRKAFRGDPGVDDTGELVSYRAAVWCAIIGFVYIVFFLSATGMTPAMLALFLFAVTVIYLGVTRIVIEGGLVFLRGPLIAQPFTAYTLGVSTMPPAGMAALAVSYAWFCDIKSFFMPAIAHAAKLSDALRLRRRAVVTAVCLALVVAVIASMCYTLGMGYSRGAYNYGDWIFRGGAETPYNAMVRKMRNPFDTDWRRLFFLAAGATVMAALTFLRYRFTRWPLHPIGFPVAYTLPVRISAFSIFLAWVAKALILRYGGIRLYRRAQPFFYGLIVGTFTGCGISFVVDMVWFPGQGHFIYGW